LDFGSPQNRARNLGEHAPEEYNGLNLSVHSRPFVVLEICFLIWRLFVVLPLKPTGLSTGKMPGDRGFCAYFGGFAGLWPSETRFVLAFFPQFDSSEPTNTCTYGENSSLILAGRALHFGPDSICLHD
jgi:hypothetical protein